MTEQLLESSSGTGRVDPGSQSFASHTKPRNGVPQLTFPFSLGIRRYRSVVRSPRWNGHDLEMRQGMRSRRWRS